VIRLSKRHKKALLRPDLSPVLVHFTQDPKLENENNIQPFDVLLEILKTGKLLASEAPQVKFYNQEGASCFYDVPFQIWDKLIDTSPKPIRGYGISVWKVIFWHLGGRPAIYTENPTHFEWPPSERFRLIKTDLCRQPQPLDWTHEREWRFPGDFNIYHSIPEDLWLKYKSSWECQFNYWWWPCVEKIKDAQVICHNCNNVEMIYVMETKGIYKCTRTSSNVFRLV